MENLRKIRCLVVDDEPMALSLIESYAQRTPFLQLRSACSNAFEALEILENENIDLVFLDIQMPELSGLELSKTFSKETRVIFTTAFDQYALDGFKADALDYLLKPFNFEEFYQAALRAKEWFSLVRQQAAEKTTPAFLFVKADYKQIKIRLSRVRYIEGLKDYVKIYLSDTTRPILTKITLKTLEQQLPEQLFMRVHRSYIIGLEHIDSLERGQVIIGNERITVADQYKENFQEYIGKNALD